MASASLRDHRVGERKQRGRNCHAERLAVLLDHQFVWLKRGGIMPVTVPRVAASPARGSGRICVVEQPIGALLMPVCRLLIAFVSVVTVTAAALAEEARKTAVVSFGLSGAQDVFRSEATGAASIVASRFGGDPVIVRFNSRKKSNATIEALDATLETTGKKMEPSTDVLLLILTSHGSRDGLEVTAARRSATLTPAKLNDMLERAGVRYKVVIISACYSGIFIPPLATADTLVITAADASHPSFGCEDRAKWTYFGDAFFNTALRHGETLRDAFSTARTLILKRELSNGFEPSNPQMAGGTNVEPLLVPRR
jgi:Peptidase C13 family